MCFERVIVMTQQKDGCVKEKIYVVPQNAIQSYVELDYTEAYVLKIVVR